MAKETPAWKQFESRVKNESLAQGLTSMQIPNEVRVIKGKPIHVKSHPDFVIGHGPFMVVFDAKSTEDLVWNIKANILRHDRSSNKLHQWNRIESAYDHGQVAGYLIWFIKHGTIVWASVPVIRELMKAGIASISPASPSVLTQSDQVPVNLRNLLRRDIDHIGERFG